jgi:nitrite reductase/ring-hydroxylating ferredoxin subunit
MKINKFILVLFLGTFFTSCKKENNGGGVPLVSVNIFIYTNTPSFIKLSNVGGWEYVTGGARGILVYRSSQTEFKAYDRNCTYQSSNACATVAVDNTNLVAVDSCCGAKFSILEGNAIASPASVSLKQYTTTFDGNVLHIFN